MQAIGLLVQIAPPIICKLGCQENDKSITLLES